MRLLLVVLLFALVFFSGCVAYDSGHNENGSDWSAQDNQSKIVDTVDDNQTSNESHEQFIGISLPLNKEDVAFRYNGIWPYGVQGGGHPHGHPGIDFESDPGKPILAVDDGKITVLQSDIGENKEDTISFVSESLGDEYVIYYTGSMKDFQISESSKVKRGGVIAYFSPWIEYDGDVLESGYIHFEVHTLGVGQGGSNCPYDFMTDEAKKDLQELLADSTYQGKDEFPLICNQCPESGCY